MALTDALISAWELDEASGDAHDSHGANDLTDTNAVGSAVGLVHGTVRDLEADAAEYFTRPDTAGLSGGDVDLTIEAWFKLESTAGVRSLVAKHDGATAAGSEYLLSVQGATLKFEVYSGNASTGVPSTSFGAISTGVWIHVIAWHDSVNNQVGIAVNAGTPDTVAWFTGVNDTATAFRLGATLNGANLYDGLLGPVRFWKRMLTSDERTQLYNGGAGLAYANFGGGPPPSVPPIVNDPVRVLRIRNDAAAIVRTQNDRVNVLRIRNDAVAIA